MIDRSPEERTADPAVGVAAAGVGSAGGATGVSAAGPGVAAADERVEDVGPSDSSVFADEPVARERPADVTDRPGPQEPGVQEGVYDQEAEQARGQRPSDGR